MIITPVDALHEDITNITTAADIVAAVSGKRIVALAYGLTLDDAGEFQWLSASTALTGLIELGAETPFGLSSIYGVLRTAPGEALRLSATTAANGHLVYYIEP